MKHITKYLLYVKNFNLHLSQEKNHLPFFLAFQTSRLLITLSLSLLHRKITNKTCSFNINQNKKKATRDLSTSKLARASERAISYGLTGYGALSSWGAPRAHKISGHLIVRACGRSPEVPASCDLPQARTIKWPDALFAR